MFYNNYTIPLGTQDVNNVFYQLSYPEKQGGSLASDFNTEPHYYDEENPYPNLLNPYDQIPENKKNSNHYYLHTIQQMKKSFLTRPTGDMDIISSSLDAWFVNGTVTLSIRIGLIVRDHFNIVADLFRSDYEGKRCARFAFNVICAYGLDVNYLLSGILMTIVNLFEPISRLTPGSNGSQNLIMTMEEQSAWLYAVLSEKLGLEINVHNLKPVQIGEGDFSSSSPTTGKNKPKVKEEPIPNTDQESEDEKTVIINPDNSAGNDNKEKVEEIEVENKVDTEVDVTDTEDNVKTDSSWKDPVTSSKHSSMRD